MAQHMAHCNVQCIVEMFDLMEKKQKLPADLKTKAKVAYKQVTKELEDLQKKVAIAEREKAKYLAESKERDRQRIELKNLREDRKRWSDNEQRLKQNIQQMDRQRIELKNLGEDCKRWSDNEQRLKQNIQQMEQEKTWYIDKNLALGNTVQENKKEIHDLQFKYQDLFNNEQTIQRELNDLRLRFSSVAQEKLTRNNPGIADLSDENRPTKLAEKFSELYDNEWTNAFEEIQKDLKSKLPKEADLDEILTIHLLDILLRAHHFCYTLMKDQLKEIEKVIMIPEIVRMAERERQKVNLVIPPAYTRLFTELQSSVITLKKCVAADKDVIDSVYKVFHDTFRSEIQKAIPCAGKKNVKIYIKKCVELTWLMSAQDPPMYLYCNVKQGTPIEQDKFRLFTKSGKTLNYLVWPMLCRQKPKKKDDVINIVTKGIVQAL